MKSKYAALASVALGLSGMFFVAGAHAGNCQLYVVDDVFTGGDPKIKSACTTGSEVNMKNIQPRVKVDFERHRGGHMAGKFNLKSQYDGKLIIWELALSGPTAYTTSIHSHPSKTRIIYGTAKLDPKNFHIRGIVTFTVSGN